MLGRYVSARADVVELQHLMQDGSPWAGMARYFVREEWSLGL